VLLPTACVAASGWLCAASASLSVIAHFYRRGTRAFFTSIFLSQSLPYCFSAQIEFSSSGTDRACKRKEKGKSRGNIEKEKKREKRARGITTEKEHTEEKNCAEIERRGERETYYYYYLLLLPLLLPCREGLQIKSLFNATQFASWVHFSLAGWSRRVSRRPDRQSSPTYSRNRSAYPCLTLFHDPT
jgi:hypothetical protein